MHSVTESVSGAAGGRGAGHGFTLRVPVTSVRLRNIQREQSHDHWKRSSNRPLSPSRGVGATSAAASETVTSLASVTSAAHSAWAGFWLLSNDWRKHSASNALRAILIDIIQAQPGVAPLKKLFITRRDNPCALPIEESRTMPFRGALPVGLGGPQPLKAKSWK